MVFTISYTIRHDMPELRIWWYWQSEPRLGRPALDVASSCPVPLPPVPSEISRLVLESMTCDFPCVLLARDSSVVAFYFFKLIVSCFSIIGLATSSQRASARNQLPSTRRATIDTFVRYHSSFLPGK